MSKAPNQAGPSTNIERIEEATDMDGISDPSNRFLMNHLNELETHLLASEHQQYFFTNSSVQNASVDQPQASIGANRGFNFSSREQSLSTGGNSRLRGRVPQRIARAGLSTPAINTDQINSANMASTMDMQSSYLTSSPNHAPSAFFDSRFLFNASSQLSPTTGVISLPYYGRSSLPNSTLNSTTVEKCKEECLEETKPSGVSFQAHPDTTPSCHSSMENKVSSPSDNNKDSIQNDIIELTCIKDSVNDISQKSSHFKTEFYGETDGYKWRKYGQKPVKGSEYPRSYYRCTHPGCPVNKKVERSHEGYITKIIYKGRHNHENPVKICRSGIPPYQRCHNRIDASTMHGELSVVDLGQDSKYVQNQNAVNIYSCNSDDEMEDEETHAGIGNEADGEGDDNESNRRSLDACAVDMNNGASEARGPRIVVRVVSEVDVIDDGFRWRKYGQKVVKGNPNPRSYYKCTSAGRRVRKCVERASNDLTSVMTTYEGKHNHKVPPPRSSVTHSTAYQSHTLNRTYPQSSMMNINPPSFLNNLNLPDLDYPVRPMPLFDMHNIGIGIRSDSIGIGQMAHQIVYPILDANIGADGLRLPKEEEQTAMEAYDQLMAAPLGPRM